MSDNTQLPDDVVERIDLEAKQFAFFNYISAAHNQDADFEDIKTWPNRAVASYYSIKNYMIGRGACWPYEKPPLSTEYATRLLQADQERDQAKKDFERVQQSAIHYANRKDEVEKQRDELQAKCDKYEKALKGVQKYCKEAGLKQVAIDDTKGMAIYHSLHLANEALCGEGDRISPNCNNIFNADRHGNCRECGSDEYNNQKDGK
jgi:hypothetical protein